MIIFSQRLNCHEVLAQPTFPGCKKNERRVFNPTAKCLRRPRGRLYEVDLEINDQFLN